MNQASDENKEKISIKRLNVDPIPNSPKQIHKYYKVDS